MGGRLILLKASCADCARITSGFESKCINKMFLHDRLHHKYPAARGQHRGRLPVRIYKDGVARIVKVIPDEHPSELALPEFFEPGILRKRSVKELHVRGIKRWKMPPDYDDRVKKLLAREGGDVLEVPPEPIDTFSFARMLAKMAHCFTVGRIGVNGFKPFLIECIRTETGPLGQYVGSIAGIEHRPTGEFEHHFLTECLHDKLTGRWLLLCTIVLLSLCGLHEI